MTRNLLYLNFEKDIKDYLKSKLPESTSDNTISDISAFITYKAVALASNIQWHDIRKRFKELDTEGEIE